MHFGRTCKAPFIEMIADTRNAREALTYAERVMTNMRERYYELYADDQIIKRVKVETPERGEWSCEYCGTIQKGNRCQSCGAPKRIVKPAETAEEFINGFLEGRY